MLAGLIIGGLYGQGYEEAVYVNHHIQEDVDTFKALGGPKGWKKYHWYGWEPNIPKGCKENWGDLTEEQKEQYLSDEDRKRCDACKKKK